MHALEKILARAAGVNEVRAGEIVNAEVDLAEINDLYLQVIESFYEMGGTKVWNPEKIALVFDHYAPAPTIKSATNQKAMREFAWNQKIPHLFDINAGICHQVMPEAGLVWPGMVLVATDSHTTTHGAFGAFGTGVGATDLATILITGKLWFRVPEVVKITLDGDMKPGIMAKDVILHILSELSTDGAAYKAIEYAGSAVSAMSMAERMVICNMAVEMGAKTSYIKPDGRTMAYVKQYCHRDFVLDETDPGYKYSKSLTYNISCIEPQVSMPHSVDQAVPIGKAPAVKVDQVFIGTCTGGRVDDFAIAAKILAGKKVNPKTRLVIIPASRKVLLESMEHGYIQTLVEAGAVLSTPGCGPCLGAHEGVLAPGEVCVTASNRNFPGRMGSTEASIYLASPATAAASAFTGRLTDPREILYEGGKYCEENSER